MRKGIMVLQHDNGNSILKATPNIEQYGMCAFLDKESLHRRLKSSS